MAQRTTVTSAEIDDLCTKAPGLPSDYLLYLRDLGWGTAESGHVIYSGPISPSEVYPHLGPASRRILIGDDMQGFCLGYDFDSKRFGVYSDAGNWSEFAHDFDLANHLSDA